MLSQKKITLDDAERELLARTGMPPVMAKLLEEKSQLFGAFAVRAGSPSNRYLMPAAPKPLSVKEKTGNWGFAKGVISVDPTLGKIIRKDGQWILRDRNPRDLPLTTGMLQETIHHIALQEVLAGLQANLYQLIGTEQDIQQSERLVVSAPKKHPANTQILFSINLNETKSRLEKQPPIQFEKFFANDHTFIDKPTWWLEKWGVFEDCATTHYPAQYKQSHDIDFKDILIYGLTDRDGKILPITGDQDLLWISVPSAKQSEFKEFEDVLNTFEHDGRVTLYEARLALYLKMGGKIEEAEMYISNESITEVGFITPYESYVIDEINRAFSHTGIKHLRNLIQHAPENHNPNTHPSVDPPIIHIWQNKIYITRDEKQLVDHIMQGAYMKANIIQVNPKWNMRRWSQVIAAQVALKQPVLADTKLAYESYCAKHNLLPFWGNPVFRKSGAQS